ncbi:MAG: glycosyl hydrolase [Clostridia bacterium]|nr:glycosyl hydrolase [Clostridia bacterium]
MKKKIILWALVLCVICMALVVLVRPVRVWVKDKVNAVMPDKCEYKIYYQNNKLVYNYKELDFDNCDVREIQVGDDRKYLINHSRGFAVGAPRDAEFDFTCAQEFIKVKSSVFDMVISKEFAAGDDTKEYISHYLNRFILNDTFRDKNRITIHSDNTTKVGDHWMQVIALTRTAAPMGDYKKNTYVYAFIYTGTQHYYRIMFKAENYSQQLMDEVYKVLYSFSEDVPIRGTSNVYTDFKPQTPENWTEETRKVYDRLVNAQHPYWGCFNPLAVRYLKTERTKKLEEQVDFEFPILLEYIYYWEDFPMEGMQQAYDDGKVVELTMQCSSVMNEDLDNYNPFFDVLDGVCDESLRKFARDAAKFGKPFIFRLNNEMNSDWTSYGGPVILNDPDLYVEVWKRIYRIFSEEGVNNAIWVFNPNNISFPPCGYNSALAYYPGNEYVQMFGITGYNTGDYYKELYGEKWRSFSEIYDEIYKNFHEQFSQFPWIITEFASASAGGDKVKWIEDMFVDLKKYPEIKAAVWFNSCDWDPREPHETVVSREYRLNENQQTIDAFKNGVKEYKHDSLLK